MNDHYYTRNPASESRPVDCEYVYRGIPLAFRTDAGVFSKGEVDDGTDLLLKSLPEEMAGDILDLGCGWGVIGICVARRWPETRVTMADVNLRALELARGNAERNRAEVHCLESDGMEALKGSRFDAVITNPPIRAGKQVIYRMFADAEECLRPGGSLILVIRKQQGAESCLRYLQTLFPKVEKTAKSGGFWVLTATKE
jgi:16S rRNA (guanine1207-N2)-methyltransferase